MAQVKISNNLYKYNENNYLISINRKNSDGELVKVQEYFKAPTDEDAINYRNKIYENNNIKVIKKKNKKKNVSKYIYQYGKDYYRITIEKSKLFPKRIDEYHYLPLKDVIEIRDDYIAKARLKKIEKTSLNKKYEGWTLNQFKDEYIEKYCINKLSAVTVNWYDNILNTYILPEYGDVKLDSLEKMISELQEFVNEDDEDEYYDEDLEDYYDEDIEDMYTETEEKQSEEDETDDSSEIEKNEKNVEIGEDDDFFKEEFEFSYAKVKEVLKNMGYNNYATFKKEVYESKKVKRKKFDDKEKEVDYLVKALGYDDFEDFYCSNIDE